MALIFSGPHFRMRKQPTDILSQRKLKNVNKSLRPPPHFPHLFILAAEVLTNTVRNNKSIRDGPLENLWWGVGGGGGRAKYKKKIRAREN